MVPAPRQRRVPKVTIPAALGGASRDRNCRARADIAQRNAWSADFRGESEFEAYVFHGIVIIIDFHRIDDAGVKGKWFGPLDGSSSGSTFMIKTTLLESS